jgi:hypothetical protein
VQLVGTNMIVNQLHRICTVLNDVIHVCQKHSYHLEDNAYEALVFFYIPSNTTTDAKGLKAILIKTTGQEKLTINAMVSILADGRKITPFVILKRNNFPNEKLPI